MKTTDLFKKRADMIEQRDALNSELNQLLANDQLSPEQEARGSELMDKLEPLKRDIEEMQKHIGASQLRERFASFAAVEKASQENEKRSFDWTASNEYRDQWIDWCRGGRAPESRGLNEFRDITTGSSSGVLVPKIYEAGILKYMERTTVVRNLADLRTGVQGSVTVRVNTLETDAAASAFWTTETLKTATALDGAWAEVNLNPVGGLPKSEVTQWAVRQANFDIEAEVINDLQRKIARGIESGYTVGTGSDQPTGLFLQNANFKGLASAYSAAHGSGSGWDSAFTLARLQELRYKTLPSEYWDEAAWVMSQDAYYQIASGIKATGTDVPLFIPSSDVQVMENQAPMTLMGRPVYIAPYAPGRQTAAVTNSIPLMFANVREAFAVREWGGISMFRDDVTTPGLIKFQAMVFANSKITRPKAVAALRITLT